MKNVGLFVDGPFLRLLQKRLGWDVNFARFRNVLLDERHPVISNYYFGYATDGHLKFLSFLNDKGFSVRFIKVDIIEPSDNLMKRRGGIVVPMVIDVLDSIPSIDVAIFCTGNKELAPLFKKLRNKGVDVELISTGDDLPPDLVQISTKYIDMKDMRDQLQYVALYPGNE